MRFFNNLSLRYKIMSIALIAIVGFGISFVVSFFVASTNATNLTKLQNIIYPTLDLGEKNYLQLDKIIILLNEAVAEEESIEEADGIIMNMIKSFDEINKLDNSKSSEIKRLKQELETYYKLAKPLTMGMLNRSLKPEQIQASTTAMQASLKVLQEHLEAFYKESEKNLTDIITITNETSQWSIQLSTIIGVILMLVLAGSAYYVANNITANIKNVSGNLYEIANGSGNLTQRLQATGNDEVGQLVTYFNTFMDKQQAMIQKLIGYSSQVGSAAENLSSIVVECQNGMQSQRSDAEQVATASNEMAATVVEVARNAEQAAEAATNANNAATEGNVVVSKTISIINQLANDVGEGVVAVNQLRDDSESIGTVLDVIRGIAEQTNLLALNAAIEAARAGEQGRGFAVVADEVRTLASRTQESTMEIQSMIENLQNSSGQAASIMNRGQATSEEGVAEAAHAGDALDKITQSVSIISNMNTQISSAAEEQSAVASEIDKNIVNISQLADVNADNITQLANAGSSLNTVAIQMQELVGQFKV